MTVYCRLLAIVSARLRLEMSFGPARKSASGQHSAWTHYC